jgi:hypothetical protein
MAANRIAVNSSLRVLAIGSSLSWGFLAASAENEPHDDSKENSTSLQSPFFRLDSSGMPRKLDQLCLALNPKATSMEAAAVAEETPLSAEQPTNIINYDFIIVGYGNAGQSAYRTLHQKCPKAKIAVVDSLRSLPNGGNNSDYYMGTATGFDPLARTVQLSSHPDTQLRYKYGILIATGARGAPPPLELFEASSLTRVLELRSTELRGNVKRPIMAPDKVRNVVIDAASRGGKIAVLGSGWEALDLVCAAEKAGRKKPTIVFGNPGPVWNILPSYLSSELRKRLVKKEFDIHDRSIVRYVADNYDKKTKRLELHTAKLYDLLDSRRTTLDLLVGKTTYCLLVRTAILSTFLTMFYHDFSYT